MGEAPGGCVPAGVEHGLGETSRRAWTKALGSLLLSGPGAWRTLRAGPVGVSTVLLMLSAPPPQDKLPCPGAGSSGKLGAGAGQAAATWPGACAARLPGQYSLGPSGPPWGDEPQAGAALPGGPLCSPRQPLGHLVLSLFLWVPGQP